MENFFSHITEEIITKIAKSKILIAIIFAYLISIKVYLGLKKIEIKQVSNFELLIIFLVVMCLVCFCLSWCHRSEKGALLSYRIIGLCNFFCIFWMVIDCLKNNLDVVNLLANPLSSPFSLLLTIISSVLFGEIAEIKSEEDKKTELNERLSRLSDFIKKYDESILETEREKIAYEKIKEMSFIRSDWRNVKYSSVKYSEKEVNKLEKFRGLLEIKLQKRNRNNEVGKEIWYNDEEKN